MNQAKHHTPDQSLLEPYHYINTVPGKDVRGKLIDCFQQWLLVENPDVLKAIKVRAEVTIQFKFSSNEFQCLIHLSK